MLGLRSVRVDGGHRGVPPRPPQDHPHPFQTRRHIGSVLAVGLRSRRQGQMADVAGSDGSVQGSDA